MNPMVLISRAVKTISVVVLNLVAYINARMFDNNVLSFPCTDRYLDYFTTPYFIFFRDSLSYLCLLGLHVAICLSPSVVSFSGLEWVISIFFAGRFLSEFKEYENRKTTKKLKKDTRHSEKHRRYVYQQSLDLDSPIEVDDFLSQMSFSTLGKYFM